MDKASENIFLDLIPESDRKHFVGKTLKNPDGTYKNEMQKALQELLNGTFVNTEDGEKLTVKELIMMKTVGFTLANPSPQNVKVLCEMGHGDEIVIGDANFPAHTMNAKVIRADGIGGVELLEAILKVIPLDTYATENFMLMETTNGDPTPEIWGEYRKVSSELEPNTKEKMLERYAFYDRAKKAYAIIASGEEAIYANVIIKKGVIK